MLRLRSIFVVLAILLLAPLLGAMSVATFVLWEMPSPQGPRLRAPNQVVGVYASGAMMWVVPIDEDRVVLVDAGHDPDAVALKAEVREREVLGVLITHAHHEQIRGLEAFPEVPVYIGAGDRALFEGTEPPKGWLANGFARLLEGPAQTGPVTWVEDGQEILLGETPFRAVHVPGHTDGHIVWAYRDVLFTGGALLAGSPLQLMPSPLSNDPDLARRSLDKLLPFDFDIVADGHSGFVRNGRAQLHRMLDATLESPTVVLRGPDRPGAESGPEVEQSGLLVRTPVANAEGLAPVFLVLDDGTEWVLDRAPAEVAEFDGRRVHVTGTLRSPHARPGRPGGLLLAVDDIRLGTGETERQGDAPLELIGAEQLTDAVHQWGVAKGELRGIHPLARGARFGEGTFVFSDGSEVAASAPLSIPPGQPIRVLARVTRDGDALWLTVHQQCDDAAPCL